MSTGRRKYESSFKRKAVELSYARGSVSQVADELGIDSNMLSRWRREASKYRDNSFPGNGKLKVTEKDKEIHELKKKLKDAELERDILKKAISIFSVSDRKNSGL